MVTGSVPVPDVTFRLTICPRKSGVDGAGPNQVTDPAGFDRIADTIVLLTGSGGGTFERPKG